MDCSLPGSSIHGILQSRILKWVALPFCRGSFQPRDQTYVSHIVERFFTIWAIWEAQTLAGWVQKQDLYIYVVYKRPTWDLGSLTLQVSGWEKIFHINGAHKKAGVKILISEKIDLKKKKNNSNNLPESFTFWHSLLNLVYLSVPDLDSESRTGHGLLVIIVPSTFPSPSLPYADAIFPTDRRILLTVHPGSLWLGSTTSVSASWAGWWAPSLYGWKILWHREILFLHRWYSFKKTPNGRNTKLLVALHVVNILYT